MVGSTPSRSAPAITPETWDRVRRLLLFRTTRGTETVVASCQWKTAPSFRKEGGWGTYGCIQRRFAMKSIVVVLLLSFAVLPANAAKKYSYFRVGNPNDVTTATTPGTVLMGGGTDVDAAFQWMCQRSGNGDFLVIRATGTDAYNPYIQQLCPNENSVATLIIPNATAANDPDVASIIQHAEALFIAGGDQSDYINFWQGTPVQSALNGL